MQAEEPGVDFDVDGRGGRGRQQSDSEDRGDQDCEQPGDGPGADYKSLLGEVVKEGGTCSVIALGTDRDTDAEFLKDVALLGKGRIFFTDRPEDLPNVFTAETIAVTRNAFISEPVETLASGQWQEISAEAMPWLPQADGYNLSYKRDWASQALVTKDEYAAPLVAWGQRGAGRTAAVCFALGGEFSESVRAWPAYGDFLQTTARWLMGEDLPPDIGLRWDMAGTALGIDLMYAGDWEQTFAQSPPRIVLASGGRAENRREATWERMQPGHYRAAIDLTEGEVVRGAIQVGKHTMPFGPLTVGSNAECGVKVRVASAFGFFWFQQVKGLPGLTFFKHGSGLPNELIDFG